MMRSLPFVLFVGERSGQVDSLESAICDIREEIVDLRSRRVELDQALEALETRWLMLEGQAAGDPSPPLSALQRVRGLPAGIRGGLFA
jgi:hypothetical protein